MTQYIASKSNHSTETSTPKTPPSLSNTIQPNNQTPLQYTAYGNDDDSVSTLGNATARKWRGATSPSPLKSPFPVPHSITHSAKPTSTADDRSTGSVSTLNTRINSIEGQFQELSGTMEHIKNMLTILANPTTTQDGDPKSRAHADRGNSVGDAP